MITPKQSSFLTPIVTPSQKFPHTDMSSKSDKIEPIMPPPFVQPTTNNSLKIYEIPVGQLKRVAQVPAKT